MARYIDADAFEKQITNRYFYIDVVPILDKTPTADVVEVVRCKDCKFGIDYYNDGDCYCKIPTGEMVWLGNNWNGYCSYGERKEVKKDERFNQQAGCD